MLQKMLNYLSFVFRVLPPSSTFRWGLSAGGRQRNPNVTIVSSRCLFDKLFHSDCTLKWDRFDNKKCFLHFGKIFSWEFLHFASTSFTPTSRGRSSIKTMIHRCLRQERLQVLKRPAISGRTGVYVSLKLESFYSRLLEEVILLIRKRM